MFGSFSGVLDFIASLKNNNRLKVEVDFVTGATVNKVAISATDTSADFLDGKISVGSTKLSKTITGSGGDETLVLDVVPGNISHSALSGLSADDHTQYVLLAGRVGGQTINGSTSSNQDLILNSTSGPTKGKIYLGSNSAYDQGNDWLGVNTTSPRGALHVVGTSTAQIRGVINFHISNDTVSSKATFGKARGTTSSPTAVQTNDVLANYTFFGYGTNDYIQGAAIRGVAQQTFTNTAAGTQLELQTAAIGGTTMLTGLTITSAQRLIAANALQVQDSSDTTNGNLRYATTNTEFLGRENGTWKNLTITPTTVSATAGTSTTSSTYANINTMTITPAAGTYMVIFQCTAAIGDDTDGDISIALAGTEQTNYTRNVAASAAGVLGATGAATSAVCIIHPALTVNGSKAITAIFRENGAGTLTVTQRTLTVIPISR